MKLCAFVAAAAVIGGSFLIPVPAEARNGWNYLGKAGWHDYYFKNQGCTGNVCAIRMKATDGLNDTYSLNCSNYTAKSPNTKGWKEVMPGSPLSAVAGSLCR